jgi:dolichyl-diphosphooligosaccharide--protein glycosyltransferase
LTSKQIRRQHKAESHERRRILTALIIIAVVAFLGRVVGNWQTIFNNGSGDIWFRGNDAWYHWRLIENMAANWPRNMLFDPFTGYPEGAVVVVAPLLSWIVVGIGKLLAFGAPSEHLLKTIAVLLPPVAGVLTMIPVYFIGREVYSRWVGVVAAGLVMLLPTQFLSRSILGFADHHVLEALFSTTAMLFLVMGYKRRQYRWYTWAGAALAAYFLSWHGALFILSVILLWLFVQYVFDMYRGMAVSRARMFGPALAAAVALVTWFPFRHYNADWKLSVLFFVVMMGLIPVLEQYRKWAHGNAKWWAMILGTGGVVIAGLVFAMPGFKDTMIVAMQITFPTHLGVRSIGETKALDPGYFLTVYAANLLTAGAALYWTLKERHEFVLIALWGVLMLMFTITQMRWEYYLVMPLALLSAYGFVRVGTFVRKEVRRGSSLVSLLFLLFATCVAGAGFAAQPSIMTSDWYEALTWMRENTPPPYQDTNEYYELDSHEVADYAVLSWWDYGHFITSVAHRVPVTNPFQAHVDVASRFFVDGEDVPGVQYVVVDASMVSGKWYAMPSWLSRYVAPGTMAPEDSPVYQLWIGEYPGWQVVHRNQTVVVLERAETIDKVVPSSP